MRTRRVVLIGGTGFIGSAVANRLTARGCEVLVPTRRRARAAHLLPLPTVEIVEADVHDPATLERLFTDADAVVNLVGVLHSRPGQPWGPDFARAHVELPRGIVEACRRTGVGQLVHLSALGARADGPSEYQRSKAAGEDAVRAAEPTVSWTILRPSVVFGRGDHFVNLFASLVRIFPILPLAGANARFQPIFVGDVAEVACRALEAPEAAGRVFELGGPDVFSLREIVHFVSRRLGLRRLVIPLPEGLAMAQAALMELAPAPLMSRDNVRSMRVDNVTDARLPFDLVPTALEAAAPGWLDAPAARHG